MDTSLNVASLKIPLNLTTYSTREADNFPLDSMRKPGKGFRNLRARNGRSGPTGFDGDARRATAPLARSVAEVRQGGFLNLHARRATAPPTRFDGDAPEGHCAAGELRWGRARRATVPPARSVAEGPARVSLVSAPGTAAGAAEVRCRGPARVSGICYLDRESVKQRWNPPRQLHGW